jgi:hypothetical protein
VDPSAFCAWAIASDFQWIEGRPQCRSPLKFLPRPSRFPKKTVLDKRKEKNMKYGARNTEQEGLIHSERFLTVESAGIVLMDRMKRMDMPGFETWSFKYFEDHVRVRKLYPSRGPSIKLHVDLQHKNLIQMKRHQSFSKRIRSAKHEAGHALICYTLQLFPVRFIDLRTRIISGGNLYAQIENREPVRPQIARGSTSLDIDAQDLTNMTSFQLICSACYGLGGIAGCRGDETGAENDLMKVNSIIASIPELASNSGVDFAAVSRLRDELLILANEIIADPAIVPRHEILTEALLEDEYLERTEIEKILDPVTLPNYLGRIVEIGTKFNIHLARRDHQDSQAIPKSDPFQRNSIKNSSTDYPVA